MLTENEFKPIFANSLTRIILIDKAEYFLNYQHDEINLSNSNIDNISLGRIILSPKPPSQHHTSSSPSSFIQYQSSSDLLISNTINQSLLANDPLLIGKIVSMLEGTLNNKQIYKIEGDTFKIISNVKEGIHLILFSCKLIIVNNDSFDNVLAGTVAFFRKKKEIKESLSQKFRLQKDKNDDVNMIQTTLERDLTSKENSLLKGLSEELNKKKEILRKLNHRLNNEEDICVQEQNKTIMSKGMSGSQKIDEGIGGIGSNLCYSSLNLSLSDL